MQSFPSLTEGSIGHRLLVFAFPILIGNVLQSLNGSVNAMWVGRFLGEAALTATSISNTVLFLLLSALFGASMASTILIGQYLGARQLDNAKRVVGTSATFFFATSFIVAALGWVICEPLLRAMSTPDDALPLAVAYMRVIFLALPIFSMATYAVSVLRGAGDAKTPLHFMLLSVVLDMALNPLFIFGLGPFEGLGITGSACATLVSQGISLVALIVHLYRRKHMLCLHGDELALLRVDWSIVGTLVRKGVPMALQLVVVSLSLVLMFSLVNRFGVDTSAAFGAAYHVWNYIQMPSFAMGMAVSSMVAQNVGAQKWDRVATIARMGVLFNVALTGGLVLLVEVFAVPALGVFLPSGSPALDIAVHLNRIAAWSFVFFGISLVLFGVVRATGAVVVPLLVLVFSLLGVRFPMAELLIDRFQADAIWWSFPVSSLVALALTVLYYRFGRWRQVRLIPAVHHSSAATAD